MKLAFKPKLHIFAQLLYTFFFDVYVYVVLSVFLFFVLFCFTHR